MNKLIILTLVVMLVTVEQSHAQLSLSNILEYQLGNLPETEPSNLSALYNQLNISYQYNQIRFDTRIELFQVPDVSRSYANFTHKSINFEDKGLSITVGNYYHIVGRGLLLRSYEIPGTIVEDLGFRTRYGFYRDIEGIKGGYSDKFFEIYLFQGRPLNNLVPPNLNEINLKRPHLLEGIEGRFYLSDWQIGTTYLRDNIEDKVHEYGALSVGTILLFDLQIYGEYTRKTGGDNGLFDLSDETAHALYASINGQFDAIGVIFEYKDYNDFQLGYNDPPSLVKEHQYLLLNRNTHSVAAINETGWQSEFYYAFEGGHLLNINLSEAVNTLFDKRYIFQEQFAEFSFNLNPSSTIKGYIDRNMEDLLAIKDRYTAGVYYESAFSELWGTTIDLAYQTLNYTQGDKDRYYTIRR